MVQSTELGTGICTRLHLFCCFTGTQSRKFVTGMTPKLQEHRPLQQKIFGQYNLSQETLESGADTGPLCYEEVSPTAPPSPSQPCGLWFFRSAGSEGRKCTCCSVCHPRDCRLGPQMWKSMCAPDGTLEAGSSKTSQRTSPGPWWLLLLMQGLYFRSL